MNGSIRQRSKGSWQIRYDAPLDGTGKRKYISETIKGNKKQAEQVLRDRLAAIEKGGYVARDKETVDQFMQRWMETYAATNTTIRTQQGYRGYIRRYIGRTVGNVELQALTAQQIQGVYSEMLDRGLSKTTVVQLHRILKQALSHGVRWGVLMRNVAEATTPPRLERKEATMWDVETINKFLAGANTTRFSGLYYFAVWTGLRRSEFCGLKWENVALAAGRLSVVKTLQRIPGHGMVDERPDKNAG